MGLMYPEDAIKEYRASIDTLLAENATLRAWRADAESALRTIATNWPDTAGTLAAMVLEAWS